jgi:hypothetical protein
MAQQNPDVVDPKVAKATPMGVMVHEVEEVSTPDKWYIS